MKKVLLSIIMMLGLSVTANASLMTAPFTIPFGAVPVLTIAFANDIEYKACNDESYLTAKFAKGSNHYFALTQCDYSANRANYILK